MISEVSIIDQLSSVRSKLDYGPLNARTLRAVQRLWSNSRQERILDGGFRYIANLVVHSAIKENVRFCEVSSEEDWKRVRELRKRCYPVLLPYLVNVLEPDGSDRHDRHSFVYAAFVNNVAVATIRATPYPYETLHHVSEDKLGEFLGARWRTDYVEWGRLLVDREYSKMRLVPALITYAGLRLLVLTPYRNYFGYTKPGVRKMVSKFGIESDTMQFEIPSRGSHHYIMVKGSFSADLLREIPRWLRRVSNRMTPGDHASMVSHAVGP